MFVTEEAFVVFKYELSRLMGKEAELVVCARCTDAGKRIEAFLAFSTVAFADSLDSLGHMESSVRWGSDSVRISPLAPDFLIVRASRRAGNWLPAPTRFI
jgi:hypothetical protein